MKIALCLTGLIGNLKGKSYNKGEGTQKVLDICSEKTKKHILDKNDVDIFLHSWETDYENQLIEKYNPKGCIIEKQIKFKPGIDVQSNARTQAHYSKWYSIKKAIELKKAYEQQNKFTYDFVLQARFDLVWLVDILFEKFDKDKFYIPKMSQGGVPWGWPNKLAKKEIGDFFFFSNSENMDRFAELYDNINPYIKGGCPTWAGISNHMLAKYHLSKLGLLPDNIELAGDDGIDNIDFQLCRSYVKFREKLKNDK